MYNNKLNMQNNIIGSDAMHIDLRQTNDIKLMTYSKNVFKVKLIEFCFHFYKEVPL